MISFLPTYFLYIVAIIAAAAISMYAVGKIIFITRNHRIFDTPDDTRKIHGAEIPSLGGIGIFIGYIVVACFFWPRMHFVMPYVLASSVILFFTGIYDDLANMSPSKKLLAQLSASLLTVLVADIRIESFYGLFGMTEVPYWTGIMLTTIACTFFINAFNFIDGIDGLACTLAVLYVGLMGSLFFYTRHYAMAGISFSLMGATIGLLFYNRAPAKIYMGDTGSMLLGFTIFVFSVFFLKMYAAENFSDAGMVIHSVRGAMLIVFSILFFPLFDAVRVFLLRLSLGKSPLKADRSHLHYYLLDAGFTHSQSVLIILGSNVVIIASAFLMQDLNPVITLLTMVSLAMVMLLITYRLRMRKMG